MSRRLAISFSGGETSGLMTHYLRTKLRDHYDEMVVVFANTGQEREETLEFVAQCDAQLGFNTVFLEANVNPAHGVGTVESIVSFASANRNGDVFESVIAKYGIPNSKFPNCTRELKQRPIEAYLRRTLGWRTDYDTAIGIRVDEIDRIAVDAKARRLIYPLVSLVPTTKAQVNAWWAQMPFRLRLKGYEGNCKWCWKKSFRKHLTLIQDDPTAYDFPLRMESQYGLVGAEFGRHGTATDYRRVFFRGNKSTVELLAIAASDPPVKRAPDDHEPEVPFDAALDIGDSCEESCEVFSAEIQPPDMSAFW